MKQLWVAALLFAAAGCGYHVAGHGDLVPKNVKTVAIAPFGNVTTRYQLAKMLPEDISREFLSRTRYRVISDTGQADAVLTGTLVNFSYYPTTFDPVTGRATAVQATILLQLTLTDRLTGARLFYRPNAEFRANYEIAVKPEDYFDESGAAMIRVSKDVARSVVSAVLENF